MESDIWGWNSGIERLNLLIRRPRTFFGHSNPVSVIDSENLPNQKTGIKEYFQENTNMQEPDMEEHIDIDDADSMDVINDPIEFAYKDNPWRDGSAREPLTNWRRQNNLKAVAPDQMRKIYSLHKRGHSNELPLDLLMSVSSSEGQYALLMSWCKLQGIDRPCVRPKVRLTKEKHDWIRELRSSGKKYREIHVITGVSKTTISRYTHDIKTPNCTDELNHVARREYRKYFCQLNQEQKEEVLKMIEEGR